MRPRIPPLRASHASLRAWRETRRGVVRPWHRIPDRPLTLHDVVGNEPAARRNTERFNVWRYLSAMFIAT